MNDAHGSDRDYVRRLGRFVDEANAEALREHLSQPIEVRLARSFALARRYRGYAAPKIEPDDPAAFYARARELGLIRD